MKRLSYLVTLVFLMGLTLFSCKDDEAPETTEQKNTRLLTSGPFTVATVDRGEGPVAPTGTVTISFNETNKTYSVTGADNLPAPFPASGSWVFTDQTNFNRITLTGGDNQTQALTITELTENALTFTYQASGVKPTDPTIPVTVKATR